MCFHGCDSFGIPFNLERESKCCTGIKMLYEDPNVARGSRCHKSTGSNYLAGSVGIHMERGHTHQVKVCHYVTDHDSKTTEIFSILPTLIHYCYFLQREKKYFLLPNGTLK